MMKTIEEASTFESLTLDSYKLSVKIHDDLKEAGYAIYRFKHRTFNE